MVSRGDPTYEQVMRSIRTAEYACKRAEKNVNKALFNLTSARMSLTQCRNAVKRMIR